MHFISLFLFSSLAFAAPKSSPFEIYLYGEKPGVSQPFAAPAGKAIRIHMARDGFATLAIRFPEGEPALLPLSELGLKGDAFGGEATTVNAYAIGVQAIEKASFKAGKPAQSEVADILVPVDYLNDSGFHIPNRRIPTRAQYLFELHAPEGAQAGDYDTKISFKRAGQDYEIPLQIRVHKLKLPKHFKLKTSFGFAPYGALIKHFGKWADKEMEVHETYMRLAVENRIDLHKFYVKIPKAEELKTAAGDPLKVGDKISFLRLWDKARSSQFSPLGFTASFTDLPVPEEEKKNPTEAFWKALQSSVIQHDLLDKSFVYFVDEPEAKTYPALRESLKKIREWAPQLMLLGTLSFRKDMAGSFNLWCPNLIQWDYPGFSRPEEYLSRRNQQGEHFWVYSSCSAHGCGPSAETNTADLVIDRAAAYHRAFAWAAFDAQAEGILYYNTVEGYGAGDLSPWREPFLFHGNGEGNLFYPCTLRTCGTANLRVLPSLRLKTIRDGLEDVQILEAGLEAGLPVRQWAKAAYRGVRDFSKTTADYEKVKVRVLEALDGPSAAAKPAAKAEAKPEAKP